MSKIFDDHSNDGAFGRYHRCTACKGLIDFHFDRATSDDQGKTWYHSLKSQCDKMSESLTEHKKWSNPMRYYISFDYESASELNEVAEHVKRSYSGSTNNLYIHTGTGPFYQQNRKCICGSHVFEDVPDILQHKVKCVKCGTLYDVQ